MIVLLSIIVVAISIVSCVGIAEYSKYKAKELDYQREQAKTVTSVTESEASVELAREKTKQLQIKADYKEKHNGEISEKDIELEITKEKTKQLEIKERHYKEHGERLYV